jgi:uncharacterized repeat protein (TIGR02543 family)
VLADVPAAAIQLNGVDIATSGLAFEVRTGSNVTLILQDQSVNTLRSGSGPGIQIGGTGTLTIQGETDDSGAIHAYCPENSAAIGGPPGGAGGRLTINSGTVTAYGDYSNQDGAAIGNSYGGTFADITINGGIVTVTQLDVSVFGIGGPRCGDITITGGAVSASAVYVAGMTTGANKSIAISGGTVNVSGTYGSGLVGGRGGNITISGGTVNAARNWAYGAGIVTNGGNLILSGGVLNAAGGIAGEVGDVLILDSGVVSVSPGYGIGLPVTTTAGTPSAAGGTLKLWTGQSAVTVGGTFTGSFKFDLNNNAPGFTSPVISALVSADGSFAAFDDSFGLKKISDATNTQWLLLPTVVFDKNGGDTEPNPTAIFVEYGGTVGTLPTPPTRSGYRFLGWWTQNGTGGDWGTEFLASTVVTDNLTIYARWDRLLLFLPVIMR